LVNINFTLSNETDVIGLDGPDFYLETEVTGFGIPQPLLRIDPSAGDGGQFRYLKREVRELDLPLAIVSNNGDNLEPKLRRLARIMADKFTLTATYADGQVWFIDLYLAGGANTTFGDSANKKFAKWVVNAKAPQPFWQSLIPTNFFVTADEEVRGLLGPTTSLSQLRIKSAQALGSVVVNNEGDVRTPVFWRIDGPATAISISSNGAQFIFDEILETGDTLFIDSELGTVIDQNLVNRYAGLAAAPKFFYLTPGSNLVEILATGADITTKISGFFSPRREVLH
jgi:hypothetical protein